MAEHEYALSSADRSKVAHDLDHPLADSYPGGHPAPGSYSEFAALTGVPEASGQPKAMQMVEHLAIDNETCAGTAARVFEAADAVWDQPTADLAVTRQQLHEKSAWMLRSSPTRS